MVPRRAVASSLAIALFIALGAGCSDGSKKSSTAPTSAELVARAATARREAATARRRLFAAQQQLAVQHRAIAAAIRRRHVIAVAAAQARASVTTVTVLTNAGPPPAAAVQSVSPTRAGDLAAIQHVIAQLDASFQSGVASGIATSEGVNYWVDAGVYPVGQCSAFESALGDGVISEAFAVEPASLTPTPGWVDPAVGAVPGGPVYRVVLDEVQTLVPTGVQRERTIAVHVTVRPDGLAPPAPALWIAPPRSVLPPWTGPGEPSILTLRRRNVPGARGRLARFTGDRRGK